MNEEEIRFFSEWDRFRGYRKKPGFSAMHNFLSRTQKNMKDKEVKQWER